MSEYGRCTGGYTVEKGIQRLINHVIITGTASSFSRSSYMGYDQTPEGYIEGAYILGRVAHHFIHQK